jgi:ubiquinone/menaquinone biosynthesis C-methylase UbiE
LNDQNIWELSGRARHRQERRAQITAFYLQPKEGDVILDVGCGEGFVTSHLLKASLVVGLELSENSLKIAKQKLKKNNVQFIRADATDIPLRESSVDKVVALEVLEHLPIESQQRLCREIDRVLKKGGTLIITVPYKEQITYTRCIHCGKLTPLWGHLHSMDEGKVSELLPPNYALVSSYRFPNVEIVSTSAVFQHLPFRFWLLLNNLLSRIRKGYWILLKYIKVKG